jgi:hypothetical protein
MKPSTPSGAEVMKASSYAATILYVFKMWHTIKHGAIFHLLFLIQYCICAKHPKVNLRAHARTHTHTHTAAAAAYLEFNTLGRLKNQQNPTHCYTDAHTPTVDVPQTGIVCYWHNYS